jgi:TolA-binding protein
MRKVLSILLAGFLLVSCGTQADQDLYESAKENLKNEEYVNALADFRKLVDNFPKSKYRAEVYFEIGKLYHGKVDKNLNDEQSFKQAISYYESVYKNFPNDKNAPNALFMSAFLYANELGNLELAKERYELFMQKYPDHEMAASAQAELDNLGRSAEEILQKKMVQGSSEQ